MLNTTAPVEGPAKVWFEEQFAPQALQFEKIRASGGRSFDDPYCGSKAREYRAAPGGSKPMLGTTYQTGAEQEMRG